jgi:hypothetical protein
MAREGCSRAFKWSPCTRETLLPKPLIISSFPPAESTPYTLDLLDNQAIMICNDSGMILDVAPFPENGGDLASLMVK